jgi:thiosulfate dehydrogenase (quinone) large subunit
METTKPGPGLKTQWRLNGIGVLRIVFGIVWRIDAWFKCQPDFVNNFTTYLTGAQSNQPWLVQQWIQFWVNTVGVNPAFVASAIWVS